MRLYLSSFGVGNQPAKLVSLVGSGKRAVVILNALDYVQEVRDEFLASQTKDLVKLGFTVGELDLRNYFGKQDELEKVLKQKDLVWINGGNTFILRKAMKQSGFDVIIPQLFKTDSIVYAGFSAAVCVITPTLKGLDITDDPHNVPKGYEEPIIWEGLNFIDYSVAVHYKSDHSESHLTDKEIEFYQKNKMPFKTLRDGEVIVVDDGKTETLE